MNLLTWGTHDFSHKQMQKADKIQCTLEFLREHECPRNLRLKIIQWTRFHEDHQDENIVKKALINELPAKLQKDLTKHLYSREISRLPLFSFIESVDDTNEANDALQV
jgi:O-glycosyl hydrolase